MQQLLERASENSFINAMAKTIILDLQAKAKNKQFTAKNLYVEYPANRFIGIMADLTVRVSPQSRGLEGYFASNDTHFIDTVKGVTKLEISPAKEVEIVLSPSAKFYKEWTTNNNKETNTLFVKTFYSTLLHELQHFLDWVKSKGYYNTGKKTHDYRDTLKKQKGDVNAIYTQYIRLPHEINAHLTELLNRKDLDISNPTNFVKSAIQKASWYNHLTPKQQKSVVGKIVAFWYEKYEH